MQRVVSFPLLFILLFVASCQVGDAKVQPFVAPTVTLQTISAVPSVTPRPFTAYAQLPVLIGITWSHGVNSDSVLYLRENGYYQDRAHSGTLSQDDLTVIKGYLSELSEEVYVSEMIGSMAVDFRAYFNGKEINIMCGNRDCPIEVRNIMWLMLSSQNDFSPFHDERFIQDYNLYGSDDLAWVSWFNDLSGDPQMLVIGDEGILETFLVTTDSNRIFYMSWPVKKGEMKRVTDCLETLLTVEQTQNGNDLEVIKLSYRPGNLDPLIRLDKASPPTCMEKIISIAQLSLEREIPNPTLQINPLVNAPKE